MAECVSWPLHISKLATSPRSPRLPSIPTKFSVPSSRANSVKSKIYWCVNVLNALAWLIADGSLEVCLALRLDEAGQLAHGLYHEKSASSVTTRTTTSPSPVPPTKPPVASSEF